MGPLFYYTMFFKTQVGPKAQIIVIQIAFLHFNFHQLTVVLKY